MHGRESEHGESDIATARIGFIGAGAVATTLARVLAARGSRVVAVASRQGESAERLAAVLPDCRAEANPQRVLDASSLVFLAVPDDVLPSLTGALIWQPSHAVAHLSGARGAAALTAAAERGAATAALHPLMTFPRAALAEPIPALLARLAGCTWALEAGDARLRPTLHELVASLDGRLVELRAADRIPYHLSGVLVSNYVVALVGAATQLWESFGATHEEALHALLPLLRAAVEHLETAGLPAALSGPLARGDSGTIAAHLDWLARAAERDTADAALYDVYRALARLALPLALAKGTLTPEQAAQIEVLLSAQPEQREGR